MSLEERRGDGTAVLDAREPVIWKEVIDRRSCAHLVRTPYNGGFWRWWSVVNLIYHRDGERLNADFDVGPHCGCLSHPGGVVDGKDPEYSDNIPSQL